MHPCIELLKVDYQFIVNIPSRPEPHRHMLALCRCACPSTLTTQRSLILLMGSQQCLSCLWSLIRVILTQHQQTCRSVLHRPMHHLRCLAEQKQTVSHLQQNSAILALTFVMESHVSKMMRHPDDLTTITSSAAAAVEIHPFWMFQVMFVLLAFAAKQVSVSG